ncbi:MAG: hypothetical protein ACI4TV_02975 [Paludibacteraceae bacterium]
MNVWFDIYHIPQLNYYYQFIKMLSAKGHTIYMTVLDRGRNVKIANKEFGDIQGVKIWVIGKHRMAKWSVILEANLLRIIRLFFWALPRHIDISFSNGFQHGFIAKFKRQPAYSFHDDPDAGDHKMMNRFCTLNHALLYCLPNGYQLHPKDKLMPSLKEWAYLNPKVFEPHSAVLENYGVPPKEYIFLREVSVGTFNYADQPSGCILAVKDLIAQLKTADGKTMKVLFSLEEKHRRNEYPEDWILLQEPVEDIHSLIYYAAGLVSSGDSMAREAALLGIPAYYLGTRHSMPANLAAAKVAHLQNELTMPFEDWLGELTGRDIAEQMKAQEELRKKIDEEFIDINAYMMSLVEGVK